MLVLWIFIAIWYPWVCLSADISWKDDVIQVYNSTRILISNATFHHYLLASNITISSNGLLNNDGGAFRLVVKAATTDLYDLAGYSPCFDPLSVGEVGFLERISKTSLQSLSPGRVSTTIGSAFTLKAKKYLKTSGNGNALISFHVIMETHQLRDVRVQFVTDGCRPLRTIGNWNDPSQWFGGSIPRSSDNVIFTKKAGVIVLPSDVQVASLVSRGGYFIAHYSGCPSGWSAEPGDLIGTKCYKLFEEKPASFPDAATQCINTLSSDSRLVHIRNYEELSIVKRICRGQDSSLSPSLPMSSARRSGCWIGLTMDDSTNQFEWDETIYTHPTPRDTAFRDWRRQEPNNHTFSEGQSTNGELCTILVPWQEDPLILEQGSWNDVACKLKKAFVCEASQPTNRFTLLVTGTATLLGGAFEGGVLALQGQSLLGGFSLFRSATIAFNMVSPSTAVIIDSLPLHDGSMMQVSANVVVRAGLYIGESPPMGVIPPISDSLVSAAATSSQLGIVPVVKVSTGGKITVDSTCAAWIPSAAELFGFGGVVPACSSSYNVTVSAIAVVEGSVVVADRIQLILTQGADLYQSNVALNGYGARLVIQGNAARMAAYDSFDLNLQHRSRVIDEYVNASLPPALFASTSGVYRLQIKLGNSAQTTVCIPYDASAQNLADVLNQYSLIYDNGGVTVRRYGDGSNAAFGYGYTYRIEMDAPPTAKFSSGPVSINFFCQGMACNCAETVVNLVDSSGRNQCPKAGRVSNLNSESCVYPAVISVTRVDSLKFSNLQGSGSLVINGGYHRLPPICSVHVSSSLGTSVTSANTISWSSLSAVGTGIFIFAGKGWVGWDSAVVLFAEQWTDLRGVLSYLNNAPPFQFTLAMLYLDGLGSLFTVCPQSTVTVGTATWAGGLIGGRSTISVSKNMIATGQGKALRYAVHLVIQPSATIQWLSGNISLADGANITVLGKMNVQSLNGMQYMGQAQLLGAPASNPSALRLLSRENQRQWHGYFDDLLPDELRGGYYQNPLCGSQCLNTNQLNFRGQGSINVASKTNFTLSLPINLFDDSRMSVGSDARAILASGGICGNDAIITISTGTTFEFSGGNMLMDSTCQIVGAGELLVSAGEHNLGFSIDSHVTISGGAMIWPLSRGTHGSVTFNGGITIDNTGSLQVQPFSTAVHIHHSVILRDQGSVQFPELGMAAEPSQYDESDAPDLFPSGNFTVSGIMYFEGGTLSGKAEFNAYKALYLSGDTKYVRRLAILSNRGHAEWSSGDIIASFGGNFKNFGTIQMAEGPKLFNARSMNVGSPDGSDPFAPDFHSWDLGEGSLNYNQYIALRSIFVSKVPDDWTPQEQQKLLDEGQVA